MKLYKFRSLGNETDFDRAKQILETGHFWCSKFSELNDPMEGIFFIMGNQLEAVQRSIDEVYSEKNKFKICSFSGEEGFNNPVMWGYYANGFRGLAIEVEVDEKSIKKIKYDNETISFESPVNFDRDVEVILTTKLACWNHEDEYRFLRKSDKNYQKIGKITAVYFGSPYEDAANHQVISGANRMLRSYTELRNRLVETKSDISCRFVRIDRDKVKVINRNY